MSDLQKDPRNNIVKRELKLRKYSIQLRSLTGREEGIPIRSKSMTDLAKGIFKKPLLKIFGNFTNSNFFVCESQRVEKIMNSKC